MGRNLTHGEQRDAGRMGGHQGRTAQQLQSHPELDKDAPTWPNESEIGDVIAIIAHTAYHLGEIRQALCIIRS